jgi:hypothetical protein
MCFTATFDMGNIAVPLHAFSGWVADIPRVRTQVLVTAQRRRWLFHDDAVQDLVHLRHVMSIGARDDERQGDPTPVHQQMPLAPIFSPDRLGSGPPIPVPAALSSWRHQCFAIATQSLRGRRIRPACLPQRLEETCLLPFQEMPMNRTRASKPFCRQCLPLTSRSQHIHDGFKDHARILRLAPAAWFAYVRLVSTRLSHRY